RDVGEQHRDRLPGLHARSLRWACSADGPSVRMTTLATMEPRLPEQPGSPSLLRPRTVGEILGDAFRLYARHWQNLIVLVAVIVVPLSILQVLLSDAWIRNGWTTDTVQNGVVVSTGTAVASGFGALVFFAISVLMWTILTGAITRAAAGTFLGRDM